MGLLVDPEQKRVHVYWRDREVQILENRKSVACDPVLPGFALDLRELWWIFWALPVLGAEVGWGE